MLRAVLILLILPGSYGRICRGQVFVYLLQVWLSGFVGKNVGKRGIFINEVLAQRANLAGKQNAQQQAGLPDGVNDLRRPVGLCVVVGKLMLAIPTHKAHQADPGDKKQNTGKPDDRSTYTGPIDLGDVK